MATLNREGTPYGIRDEYPLAVGVGDAGSHVDHTTLDILERQALVAVDPPLPYPYFHIILLDRVDSSTWIIADPEGTVEVQNMLDEQIIPLGRGVKFPEGGRPFLAFVHLSELMLAGLRAQSRSLLGIIKPQPSAGLAGSSGTSAESQWLFSDTARLCFNQPVPNDLLADTSKVVMLSWVGVALYLDPADDEMEEEQPVSIELVSDRGRADWIRSKREGAGRDPRLLPLVPTSQKKKVLLFSNSYDDLDHAAKHDDKRFQGPAATPIVLRTVAEAGVEFPQYASDFLRLNGTAPASPIGKYFFYNLYALHLMVCVDRLDPMRSAVAEHLSRKILQMQKAIKRNPKAPDFTGLEEYDRHATGARGEMHAPEWDKHVSEIQRNQALIDRNQRIAAEEREHASPKKAAATKSGKNGARKKDELEEEEQ